MSSSSAIRTDRVRMIGLITANPGMSLEEFDKRWLQHGELIRSLGVIKRNIVKYEQVHMAQGLPAALEGALVGCHGIGIMEADTLEQLLEIFTDEEYITKGIPDEEAFMDRSATKIFPANVATFINKDS